MPLMNLQDGHNKGCGIYLINESLLALLKLVIGVHDSQKTDIKTIQRH